MIGFHVLGVSDDTQKRLEAFPKLEACVNKFIVQGGCSDKAGCIADLTWYIKCMDLAGLICDIPEYFDWDSETAEDFYTWGHNSRYANVLEPLLAEELDEMTSKVLDLLEVLDSKEEFFKEDV